MLGNAGQKIQNIVDLAEELYEKVNQLREQIAALGETLDDTHERVSRVETELAEQRALVEALAEERGIDADEVVEDATTEEAGDDGTADEGGDDEEESVDAPADAASDGEAATPGE